MGFRKQVGDEERLSGSSTPEGQWKPRPEKKRPHDEEVDSVPKHDGWGSRHTLALLGFWGFVASYAMRVNLSFAIVSMVNTNSSSSSTNVKVCGDLVNESFEATSTPVPSGEFAPSGEFNWSGEEQGIILGSFFWGYVATQVPGGMLAERIGGKWPFGIGMLITAIFSLATPFAARTGKGALIFVRVIQGLGEGVTNPAMHAILARWAPPLERSKLGAYVYAGMHIGTVIAMPLSGYLISSNIFGGWPAVFYVFGGFGIIWFIFWATLVYDSPANHPGIDAKELAYIHQSIGNQATKHRGPTPWRKMLTSMPVLAILVAQTGHGWGLYTLLTELPTYLKNVLHFDIKNNAILSALPYFVHWTVCIICSQLADFMREQGIARTVTVRKLFNTIGQWGPAALLVGAAYSGCDRVLTVTLLTLAVGINGATMACKLVVRLSPLTLVSRYVAFQVNHIDIAPSHAGVMMGFTNGFANLCGIGAPYVAGVIINDGGSLERWKLIFFISAAIYFVDNIFYLIFASGEELPWNRSDKIDEHDDPSNDPLLPSHSRLLNAESIRSGMQRP